MALLIVLVLGSCAAKRPVAPLPAPVPAPDVQAQRLLVPPATFVGEMPCKACGGMRRTLTLFVDGSYRLRQRYDSTHGGTGIVLHEVGRWQLQGRQLILASDSGRVGRYQLTDSIRLVQLGRDGEVLTANMAYTLSRAAQVDPIAESMRLTGLFNPQTGQLLLCGSGQALAVVPDVGEANALAQAAQETHSNHDLWVTVQAQWVEVHRQRSAQTQPALRIDRLLATRPGVSCPASAEPGPAG